MNQDQLILFGALALIIGIWITRARFRHEFLVQEGAIGVLFREGKLMATLPAGRHVRWGRSYHVQAVEARRTLMQVAGQEVLSADNVSVKISIVLTTQIADAAKALQGADNHFTHVYTAAQAALRAVVAGVTMDALLSQRGTIGTQLIELVSPKADDVGVKVHSAEVRDVMLPGELRKAFSDVLKAKQEAQTALERSRGESAALRNLANAARLVESVPSLATLRFLQTLEASGAGKTFVMNDLASLLPALNRSAASRPQV